MRGAEAQDGHTGHWAKENEEIGANKSANKVLEW